MYRHLSSLCLAVLAIATLAGMSPLLAGASTPPIGVTTLTGLVSGSSSGPDDLVVDYTITVAGTAIDDAVLTAKQPVGGPADPTSVQVNGVTPASGAVTATPTGLNIQLGHLDVGAYLVTFDMSGATAVAVNSTLSAALAFTRASASGLAQSNSIPLTDPDLTLVRAPGYPQPSPLGTGDESGLLAVLTNRGADAADATLDITVPAGLRVVLDDGVIRGDGATQGQALSNPRVLACTSVTASRLSCDLGAVRHGAHAYVGAPVEATSTAVIGKTAALTFTVTPDRADANTGDNSASGTFLFIGSAKLRVTLTPAKRRVVVGRSVKVVAAVRNDGPQPALATLGLVLTNGAKHFTITGFSGNTNPPTGSARFAAHALGRLPAVARRASPAPILWNLGTIAAHHTVRANLYLRAIAPGKVAVALFAASETPDTSCDTLVLCSVAETTLTAVKAPRKHRTTGSGHTASDAGNQSIAQGPALADTGPHTAAMAGVGVGSLALGVLLTAAGRRPRRR